MGKGRVEVEMVSWGFSGGQSVGTEAGVTDCSRSPSVEQSL